MIELDAEEFDNEISEISEVSEEDLDGIVDKEDDDQEEIIQVVSNAPVKYLTNKELLREIHNSKVTFCSYTDIQYTDYDVIVSDLLDIDHLVIENAKQKRASQMIAKQKADLKASGASAAKVKAVTVDPETIPVNTLVFRVMTNEHIPMDPRRRRKSKPDVEVMAKIPFPAFKHFIVENGEFKEVCRSHWRGDFETGKFALDGKISERLGKMFLLLVERYGRKSNWRSYTYLDEMQSHSLLQLTHIGLQFDESKSSNPFAFYTTTLKNCFTRVLNVEKKSQTIRDDLLIMQGAAPSYTRQHTIDHERAMAREAARLTEI